MGKEVYNVQQFTHLLIDYKQDFLIIEITPLIFSCTCITHSQLTPENKMIWLTELQLHVD
jgi:hypothetical protein